MLEKIELKEEVKHTETEHRDDLIAEPGTITDMDIYDAIIEDKRVGEHITNIDIFKIRKWLNYNRRNLDNPKTLIYSTDCGTMGETITRYLEYNGEYNGKENETL
ncbi:MAG: hypothetical protein OXE50_16040 [Chloroflexi bacterium]|nr:hypothetical protein [Chloroflexota bacterium]